MQRKTPRSALRKGGAGGGAAGGRRKISFAEATDEADEEGQDDDEDGEPEDEDPIEDPDLAAPTSSAEVRVPSGSPLLNEPCGPSRCARARAVQSTLWRCSRAPGCVCAQPCVSHRE